MKELIARLMPISFRRTLEIHREVKGLRTVPSLRCDVGNLLPAKEVKLAEILGSQEIETKWNATRRSLELLEIPDGTGGVNPGDRRAIFYLVSWFEPQSILEIGTHIGASTTHIAGALRVLASARRGRMRLVSVDVADVNNRASRPWLKYGSKHSPIDMIKEMGCEDSVTFVTATSLGYLADCQQKFDFIFLDGDHAAKTVYEEVPAALELLEENGLILLHDYFPNLKPLWLDGSMIPGPFLAVERLRMEGAGLKVLPLGELSWPTKLRSNVTSLAILARHGSEGKA